MLNDLGAERRFRDCLAETLRQETGYVQRPGGPYRRRRDGSSSIPQKPDGRWYDDDPDDTGGRTAAGILQREYDPWRAARGQMPRDVWLIEDRELEAIYLEQYWNAVNGGNLPAGVDLAVFDMGVLNGVATAIRALQQALGVKTDGHFGVQTMAALAHADHGDLITAVCKARRERLRRCKTFWKHGKGWLRRVNEIEAAARQMAYRLPAPEPAADHAEPAPSRKASVAAGPSTMVASTTAQAAVTAGGAGGWVASTEIAQAVSLAASGDHGLTPAGIAIALASSPTFWAAAIVLGGAAYIWFERRVKLIQEHTS